MTLAAALTYLTLTGYALTVPVKGYWKASERKRFGLPARTWPWMIWTCIVLWAMFTLLMTGTP